MKHQYEDYTKFCDKKIEAKRALILELESMVERQKHESPLSIEMLQEANEDYQSWVANKATLERHKPIQILSDSKHDGGITHRCGGECRGRLGSHKVAPCPSLLDVTNQLDEVMG